MPTTSKVSWPCSRRTWKWPVSRGGATPPYGKARLRELYAARFAANPDLHASAEAQLVSGEFVIQREKIRGRAGKPALEALVIYQVKAGRIIRMWSPGD